MAAAAIAALDDLAPASFGEGGFDAPDFTRNRLLGDDAAKHPEYRQAQPQSYSYTRFCESYRAWAKTLEPTLRQVHVPHPEQGFRSCLGIMRLGKGVGDVRLEAACRRALHFGTASYQSVRSILEHGLDQQPLDQELPFTRPSHENIRGGGYYN